MNGDWDRMRGMPSKWGHAGHLNYWQKNRHQKWGHQVSTLQFSTRGGGSKGSGLENSQALSGCFTLLSWPLRTLLRWACELECPALVCHPLPWQQIIPTVVTPFVMADDSPAIVVADGDGHFRWRRKEETMIKSSNISHNDFFFLFKACGRERGNRLLRISALLTYKWTYYSK